MAPGQLLLNSASLAFFCNFALNVSLLLFLNDFSLIWFLSVLKCEYLLGKFLRLC